MSTQALADLSRFSRWRIASAGDCCYVAEPLDATGHIDWHLVWKETRMATSHLRDICFDCIDQHRVARFWAEVLGYTISSSTPDETPDDPVALSPTEGGLRLWFNKVPELKVVKNRVHIDINLPDGMEIERLQRLGALVLQEIRDAQGQWRWTIMADPEGNEFCAFLPA